MSSRRFQDVSSNYTVLVNKFSRCLQDVFPTFLRCSAKTVIYGMICLGHTSEKFMVNAENLQVIKMSQVLVFYLTTPFSVCFTEAYLEPGRTSTMELFL